MGYSNMMDNNFEIIMTNFFIFGTTFENYLQNIFSLSKYCMEIDYMLIWTKCHVLNQEGMMTKYIAPKKGNRINQVIVEEIPKLTSPILAQQK